MRALLARKGAKVEVADSGPMALDILQSRGTAFDCVLMDVQMPDVDGLSVTRQIRQIPRLDRLPILAMTAGLLAEQQVRARQAGMADVIAKPMQTPRMIEQVLSAVGRATGQDGYSTTPLSHNPIPALNGIDRHHANHTMDGSLEIFNVLVDVFVQEFTGFAQQMGALLSVHSAKARSDAERLAHSLRGSSRQLGALELSDAATALEAAIHNHYPNVKAEFDQTSAALVPLLDTLQTHQAC